MGKIVLLDDLTINQIAAGEVIERPASVIKEMVENSIDAGAKNITVEIKNGGISLIRITDDGCGIAEDDMEIAFERHSTSKIRSAEDLDIVKTMGFRGEALASIASIANVEMISKTENEQTGHKLVIEGGRILDKTEIGAPTGTRITVEKLFFNTPVRYKFLKKDYTEAGYIEDIVKRIALVNPNVSFKFISNGKTIIQTNGNGNLQDIIYSIFGKEIANEIINIDYTYEEMKVTGVIGKPIIARGNRTNQLFFVNNRYIKDKNLSAAAEQAYKGMIPVGRYGFLILNLEMDPKQVDVNVHPAKLEVRFEDENKVFKAIYHAIKSGLMQSELIADVEKPNEYNVRNDEGFKKINVEASSQSLEEKNTSYIKDEEKKMGFSGIFKRRNNEEEKEERNPLEEIYNARNGIKNYFESKKENNENISLVEKDLETSTTDEEIVNETNKITDEFKKLINENEIDKEIKFENTKISSNTREIDVTTVNNLIKDATQELMSTKLNTNIDETQVLKDNVKSALKDVNEHTQVININEEEKEKMQETRILKEEEKAFLPQNTIVLEENALENVKKDSVLPEEKNDIDGKFEESNNAFDEITEKLIKAKADFGSNTQMIDTLKVREAIKESNQESLKNNINLEKVTPEFEEMYKKTFGIEPSSVRKEKENEIKQENKIDASKDFNYANMNVFEGEHEYPEIKYKFIGIAFSTYIIIEIKDELYIIDQHAAHERIMYEKVKANYYSDDEKDEQFLLLPDIITLTHKEMDIAKENIEMFRRAGFSFEDFGDNTIKLVSVPSMCEKLNTKQLFLDLLDEIDTVAVTARQEKEEKFIATVACKSAVKAKMKLDEREVDMLMQELLKLPNPFTCPHGRPTAIKMTKMDMERKFSRR